MKLLCLVRRSVLLFVYFVCLMFKGCSFLMGILMGFTFYRFKQLGIIKKRQGIQGAIGVLEDALRINIITTSNTLQPCYNGLGWEFYMAMKKYRKNIAQYVVETNEEQTYDTLLTFCLRTALNLQSKELKKNHIIAICSDDNKYSIIPYVASIFLGIKVAYFNTTLPISKMALLLKVTKPNMMFVAPQFVDNVKLAMEQENLEFPMVILGESTDYESFTKYLTPHKEENIFEPVPLGNNKDTSTIFFTSGRSTGMPKAVCCSHFALTCQSLHAGFRLNQTGTIRDNISLNYSTYPWVSIVISLIGSILTGQARVIPMTYSEVESWKLIQKYKVTTIFFTPAQAINLLKAGRPAKVDVSSLSNLITSGTELPSIYIQQLREILPFVYIHQCYGKLEVSGIVSVFNVNTLDDKMLLQYKPEACGKLIPGIWCKVVDPDTEKSLGPHETGELRIKSEYIMNGHYNSDAANSFDSQGWLKTNDIVHYDEFNCFYVEWRMKKRITYKSVDIYPEVIEQVLLQHTDVEQAAVIGIPNADDGDHPAAIVVLCQDSDLTARELEIFVAGKVENAQKLRGGVTIVPTLPINSLGEIKRHLLHKLIKK